jgi:FkbM family methyltransferase
MTESDNDVTILYGVKNNYVNVTYFVRSFCIKNDHIIIPEGDHSRALIFGDPIPGVLKHIVVLIGDTKTFYSETESITIPLSSVRWRSITTLNEERPWLDSDGNNVISNKYQKLQLIHNRLKIEGGFLHEEYPEQLMVAEFLPSNANVLEIGSNIGRNTLVIASILNDKRNLVTLECDPVSYKQLEYNLSLNGFNCYSLNVALSYIPLYQMGWNTTPEEQEGYIPVKTITFEELQTSTSIIFDTIVADCEGALYYILKDNPSVLNNIKLMIIENDYSEISQKEHIDMTLYKYHFERVFSEPGGVGPCCHSFYEVWKKV